MDVANENSFDLLKQKAVLLARENVRLVADVVRLRRRVLELEGRSPEELQQELELLDRELAKAAADLAAKARAVEEEKQADPEKKEPKKREKFGPKAQPNLSIVEDVIDLDEADKQCPSCGLELGLWEGQDDVTEEVDVIARQFVIKKKIRRKYLCKCGCIEMADLPARLVPGGRYSNGFAVETATMKFTDQLPYERIARIFGREGLVVDSQTLWDQVEKLAALLQPVMPRLRAFALKDGVVGLDQTWWKVIGHKKSWQMWELSTAQAAYFDIVQSKGEDDGLKILEGYSGIVACDAFSTHGALSKALKLLLAFCWAHVRCRVRDVTPSDPMRCEVMRVFIRDLYDVEEEAGGDLQKLRGLRDTKSRDILKRLKEWLIEQHVLPSSPFAGLRNYVLGNWDGFKRFLDDPRIPIDNSRTERGYLWPAVGRRAFVGSRSKRGTEVAALFYSLAETARRNGKDPKAYLRAAMDAALAGKVIPLPHELP